jgi:polysaccharide export outer membrane protein
MILLFNIFNSKTRWAILLLALWMAGCRSLPPDPKFKPIEKSAQPMLNSKEDLALLEESENPVYTIGSGDVLRLDVHARAEVSGKFVVGPDGMITVPLVGDLLIKDKTREQALAAIRAELLKYFTAPHTTLAIDEYPSNRITVLGRVEKAGAHQFAHAPTLIDVLANAGAMPILDKQATLSRCAIIRGRDKLIWVDLKALLNGDVNYNIRMKKGDIVYIPDSSDTSVYVMGAVGRPGSYRMTPRMTVIDAIAQAGGLTENAKNDRIGIYRAGAKQAEYMSWADLITADRTKNYAMEDGDILFIPTTGLSDFGYLLRQIGPAISVFTFGLTVDRLNAR